MDKWLASSSTNLTAETGGFNGRKLLKGDEIEFNKGQRTNDKGQNIKIARSLIPLYSNTPTVRITKGAESENLTALSEQEFLSNNYKITKDSNRMGFRLEGKPLYLLSQKELVSTAVNGGTIQLLPDGNMIILMADHQTTGGYPRIAHIVEQDLSLVAQLGAHDSLGFHLISHKEAEELKLEFENDLNLLKTGIKLSKSLK